jgi:uncharacterized protein (DUF1501 family)
MDTVTRRRFLVASGVSAAALLAAGGAVTLADILGTAGDRDPSARTLVLLTLYGGNDGLNTLIPYADPAYAKARPALAYDAARVLHLDDQFGLNPAMAGLHRAYQDGKLAVVRGVGYPEPDRSHFRSMDIWQTGRPDHPETTGWLGRWLDATGGDPRHAVSFEPVLPPVLAGATVAGAAIPPTADKAPKLLPAFGKPSPGEPPLQARAARAYADLAEVEQMIHEVDSHPQASPSQADATATATGGARTALKTQLDLVARCIEANVASRVFSVSLGGFDLHADEKEPQQRLLTELDTAITGFVDRMAGTGTGRRTVVAIYSEFGRRVRANASEGTDHGTASDMFVLGSHVRGGFYGTQPSLTDLDNGDLKFTTDFRDVYATLLDGVLGTDPGKILTGWKTRIDKLIS